MRRSRIRGLLVLAAALSAVGGVRADQPAPTTTYEIDPELLNRRASASAPLDLDFRAVGFASVASPGDEAQPVTVGGNGYLYARGVFWARRGISYVVTAAPFGAAVDTLPAGAEKLQGTRRTIYYWFGTFFGEKEGKFEVVKPPAGTVVGYIPERYQREGWTETSARFRYESICFMPVLVREQLMYEVCNCE